MKYKIAKTGCLLLLLLQLSCMRPFNTTQTPPDKTNLPPRFVALDENGNPKEMPLLPPEDVANKDKKQNEAQLPL